MIKVGKLQVNNNLNPKIFLILYIFSFIVFVVFCGFTITNFIITKNYVKLEATITEVGYRHYYDSDGYSNYIKLEYEYHNNNYNNEQRVAFRANKKVGNKTTIYVNPLNPIEVRDNYLTKLNIVISIVIIIFNLFCIKAYRTRKKEV